MKKRMFSRFTSILQHAVDALAPQMSLQEEFVHHWKAVTSYFIDNKGEKLPVEQTSIPAHLEQMLVILQEEEAGSEKGMYGPCLEYLVQHKLLETLYSLGRTDFPPGMKQIVLSFFTKLLSRIKQPLLPHVNVHKAVHRLVKTCGEVKAAPTEIEEIQFLCTVCAKVKADPYLVNFFLEVPKPSSGGKKNSPDGPIVSETSILPEFSLVSTLLNLSHSADSRVAVKACEGLLLCASLPETPAAHCLVLNTDFCKSFTKRLVDTYKSLPELINPLDLENVQAKWGMDIITEREDQQTFLGKRHLVSFLSWLDYCDQLIAIANPIVAEALSECIHRDFLLPCFQPTLLQVSETGVISATAYLTRCLRTVCSPHLLKEFVLFILGDGRKTEVSGEGTDSVRTRLIDRCNHVSEEVCLVTLQLFDTLLMKEEPHILHNLVLRNLETRSYYDYSCQDNTQPPVFSYPSVESSQSEENVPKMKSQCDATHQDLEPKRKCVDGSGKENSLSEVETDSGQGNSSAINKNAEEIFGDQFQDSVLKENQEKPGVISQSEENQMSKNIDENVARSVDTGTGDTEIQNQSEEAEKTQSDLEKQTREPVKNGTPSQSDKTPRISSTSSDILSLGEMTPVLSPGHNRTEVHKIVNSFLSLLPEELKSSYQTADSGYDMYLKDAHKQFADVQVVCQKWEYPKSPLKEPTQEEGVFFEGAFLKMLLDKLSHMLDQGYAINLQLTSVVSKLAMIPHPHLHEFLLDPYLPLVTGVRNLFAVFQKVSNEIRAQLESQPDLAQKLVLARRQLMGISPNIERLEGQSQLEAIIVLEEFCKELSAIAFVKHHAAVTNDR